MNAKDTKRNAEAAEIVAECAEDESIEGTSLQPGGRALSPPKWNRNQRGSRLNATSLV